MGFRKEAIECVKDHVLSIHKQIYVKYDGNFDRIYSDGKLIPGITIDGQLLPVIIYKPEST